MTMTDYQMLRKNDTVEHEGSKYKVRRLDKTSGFIICFDPDYIGRDLFFFYHRCRLVSKNRRRNGKAQKDS